MKIKTLAVAREEISFSGEKEAELRVALESGTPGLAVSNFMLLNSRYGDSEMETIVSIFEDDGTFVRSFDL